MNSNNIAPMIEPTQPAVCSWRPISVVARKPPTNEPAMPRRIVTIQPPGSRPGIRNFAITPTIRPKRSHPRMLMLSPPKLVHPGLGPTPTVEQRECQRDTGALLCSPCPAQLDHHSRVGSKANLLHPLFVI